MLRHVSFRAPSVAVIMSPSQCQTVSSRRPSRRTSPLPPRSSFTGNGGSSSSRRVATGQAFQVPYVWPLLRSAGRPSSDGEEPCIVGACLWLRRLAPLVVGVCVRPHVERQGARVIKSATNASGSQTRRADIAQGDG